MIYGPIRNYSLHVQIHGSLSEFIIKLSASNKELRSIPGEGRGAKKKRKINEKK